MRTLVLVPAIVALSLVLPTQVAHAQDVLYRCESADGISIQGKPCPKGVTQRKLIVQRPATTAPTTTQAAQSPATAAPAVVQQQATPAAALTPASAMRGPADPYPLWQCMRADGSTFDSRDGVPGKQWVIKSGDPDVDADTPPKVAILPKKGEHIVRSYASTETADDDAPPVDPTPPPAGAAPGQWVPDQCTRLEPQQACERFAARRDGLRRQIYAAKPSERATWAPEEQDLTSMLFAACGR